MQKKTELYFLLGLLAIIAVLTFFIYKPFIYVLFLAVVVATIFQPVFRKALKISRNRPALASFLTTLFVLLIVIIPVSLIATQILRESTSLYSYILNGDSKLFSGGAHESILKIKNAFPVLQKFDLDLNKYAEQFLNWLLPYWGSLFSNLIKITTSTFIFLIALYYMFKDGEKLKLAVREMSPLKDSYDNTIFKKMENAINSIIKGSLIIAIIQGIVTSIGFLIFGVPSAFLWGTIASITALIPSVGTSLVVVPAIIYLFFSGSLFPAIGLAIWGFFAVGLIDNFLGPKLVERGIKIHPFLILLSVLGGLALFGPIGFIIGPVVLSLLFTLSVIYSEIVHQQI